MRLRAWAAAIAIGAAALSPAPALAWEPLGHQVIAALADRALQKSDPAAHAKLLALLGAEKERGKGRPGMIAAATWLDELSERSEEARGATRSWRSTRLKFDAPDLKTDCFGRKPLPAGYPASRGPQDDCSVDKVQQFAKELQDPATSAGERLTALRFLIALVGDVSDPMQAIDRGDNGGACVAIAVGGAAPERLSTYWDETLVKLAVGRNVASGAARIATSTSAADVESWQMGTPEDWIQDSYAIAKSTVYSFAGTPPAGKVTLPASKGAASCGSVDLFRVGADYETRGLATVRGQLAKGGLRLAAILSQSLK